MDTPIVLYACRYKYTQEHFRLEIKKEDACPDLHCDFVKFKLYHVKYVDDPEGYSSIDDPDLDTFKHSDESIIDTDPDDLPDKDEHLLFLLQRTKEMPEYIAFHRPPSDPPAPMEIFNARLKKTGNPHSGRFGPCRW